MNIFSVTVLPFTIQSYRTVDLIRTSDIAQKNRYRQEGGRTVPETSYGTILLSAEMQKQILKIIFPNC